MNGLALCFFHVALDSPVGVYKGSAGRCRVYLCYSHGTSDGTNAIANRAQEANLHAVDCLVEFFNLLLLWRLVIPLFGD